MSKLYSNGKVYEIHWTNPTHPPCTLWSMALNAIAVEYDGFTYMYCSKYSGLWILRHLMTITNTKLYHAAKSDRIKESLYTPCFHFSPTCMYLCYSMYKFCHIQVGNGSFATH